MLQELAFDVYLQKHLTFI